MRDLCELVSQIALLLGARWHVAKHLFLKPWCQENRWWQLAGWAMWIHMNSLLHCLVVIDNGFAFAGAYLHKTLANHGGSGGGVENKKKRNWKLLLSFQPYYELSHSCRKSKTFFIIVKKVKQAGLWHSEIVHELLGLQHCLNEVEGCVAVWACVRKEHVHLEISHWHIWKYI